MAQTRFMMSWPYSRLKTWKRKKQSTRKLGNETITKRNVMMRIVLVISCLRLAPRASRIAVGVFETFTTSTRLCLSNRVALYMIIKFTNTRIVDGVKKPKNIVTFWMIRQIRNILINFLIKSFWFMSHYLYY